jgi:iron complex outermembrane receptor protein
MSMLALDAGAAGAAGEEAPPEAAPAGASGDLLAPIVVESSALAGGGIDIDKIPGNVQVLDANDLLRDGAASLTAAMNSSLGSVNINDNLVDPFQPDILFRGFVASPVLGTPQGLAVYQNGVRINEAFGDTVNWDLFPDVAIRRVEIVSSSPVYGLNALGGGVSVTMKNAFNYAGRELELSGGSYGQHSVVAEYGVHSDLLGFYAAGRALNWDGWREFAQDRVRELFTALSLRTDKASVDLSYTRAQNGLNGQGPAPVQELAVNRSLVFTGPQSTANALDFVTLNGTWTASENWSVQSVAYYRGYAQSIANGNSTEYTACSAGPYAGDLCQADGATPLTDMSGQFLPDISRSGSVPIGENDFELLHSYGRGASLQAIDAESWRGRPNQFTAGATLDDALTHFYSGAQIGTIDHALLIGASNLFVATSEAQENAATAAGGNVSATPVSLEAVNKALGLYATDSLDLSPAATLTASGRYNVADIDLRDLAGANLTGRNRYTHFNPALGATYKIGPALTVYADLAENTRTPTPSEIECSDPKQPCLLPSNLSGDPPTLRQVVARTVEFGLRGRTIDAVGSGNNLSWNMSAFRSQLRDDIYGVATSFRQGFFQNIGATRRQGLEANLNLRSAKWSTYANFSFIAATFESALAVPSPSNPYRDAAGDIHVVPGDFLPGIPRQRLKLGADYQVSRSWTVGATLAVVGGFYLAGDASNQLAPIAGYHVLTLHSTYRPGANLELFATINNVLDAKYATWGTLGDPTGVGTPGVPPGSVTNGPGVDPRFLSPAAPFELFGGIRFEF